MPETEIQNSPSGLAANVSANSGATTAGAPVKKEKAKNARTKPSHPPTAEMVNNAIGGLKERGGSSLQAIKKFLVANYKVDAEKMAPFIKKYLRAAVVSGLLVQTKGKGASGSFKLASTVTSTKKSAGVAKKKTTTSKKAVVMRAAKKPVTAEESSPKSKKQTATKAKTAITVATKRSVKEKTSSKPFKKPTTPKTKKLSPVKKTKKVVAAEKKAGKSKEVATVEIQSVAPAKIQTKAKKGKKAAIVKKAKTAKPKTVKITAGKVKSPATPKRKK